MQCISIEQIKANFEDHAKNLINLKKLEYDKYAESLDKFIKASEDKVAHTKEAQSLKETFIKLLTELKHEEYYLKHKITDALENKEDAAG